MVKRCSRSIRRSTLEKASSKQGHDFSFSSARTRIDSRSIFQLVEILCEAKNESLVVIHQRAVS